MVLIGLSSSVSNSYNYKNQATLLFYFSKYIQWPASYNEGDFIVGVYGEEEVAEDIKRILAVRQIDNRKIIVKRFNSTSQVPKKCNLLYLSANKSSSFYRIENHLKRTHTLLVTEKTGLGARGSHINLIIENNRMKFELNKASIAKSGLKVSSALIKQAIEI
tara:strand:- start:139 stop:624 length:486 start_codon:yes stop_codon:yes gene_type:complete